MYVGATDTAKIYNILNFSNKKKIPTDLTSIGKYKNADNYFYDKLR